MKSSITFIKFIISYYSFKIIIENIVFVGVIFDGQIEKKLSLLHKQYPMQSK